jgi:hypothetical protein
MAAPSGGIIHVEDCVPRTALGAGHPRSLAVMRELAKLHERVIAVAADPLPGSDLPPDALPANVEVATSLPRALEVARTVGISAVWVARPNKMAAVARLAQARPGSLAGMRVVYDAEAVFALREARRSALLGTPWPEARVRRSVRQELYAAEWAWAAAAVSREEADVLAAHLRCPVAVLGFPAEPVAGTPPFASRVGALFVGPATPADSPNADSLRFLLAEVRAVTDVAVPPLTIVGRGTERGGWLAALAGPGVALLGVCADLRPHYDAARMCVAPTRFAAGIPIKVLDAARHGVPVVATSLLARQLGWRDGVELLVADDAPAFAAAIAHLHEDAVLWSRLRAGAWAALDRDYAPTRFSAGVRDLLDAARAA